MLNGGVSLAVWMGGAVREIDRVTRGEGTYGVLLDLLNASARADVIAGTSAGGINGAALALGQANNKADVGLLRDLWNEQGRMESLLQQPFRGSPASLLRGDDYFLPKLHEAMKRLSTPWEATSTTDRPLDLIITTTLLHGARTVSVDSLGQQLPQMQHEAHFSFQRGDRVTGIGRDDFDPETDPEIAARLALAARCTAGFPVAFEPCFVPATECPDDEPGPAGEIDLVNPSRRPDLGRFVSWREAGPADEVPADRSRYAVDGGLLENTPTRAALDAISRLPAGGQVQRVVLLVYPHAPANRPDPADRTDEPPAVAGAMSGILGALLSQGSRTFVEEIEASNKAAASRRGTRHDVLESAPGAAGLEELAKAVYQHYGRLRIRRSARDLAARHDPPSNWSYERIRRAAEDAQRGWLDAHGALPYVPGGLPSDTAPPAPHWNGGDDGSPVWNWGITTALDLTDAAIDLLGLLVGVVPRSEAAERIAAGREAACAARTTLREVRDGVDDIWVRNRTLARLQPSTPFWNLRLAYYAKAMLADDQWVDQAAAELTDYEGASAELTAALVELAKAIRLGMAGHRAADAVQDVVEAVGAGLEQLAQLDPAMAEVAGLRPWQQLFAGLRDNPAGRQAVYARLLWLHVATWTIAEESPTEASFPVDLVQLSLQTRNAFADFSSSADDKVGGMSLNRFGGFLKRSWRMNDWTWGRMDAATMLCQVILSPERLRRRAIQEGNLAPEPINAELAAAEFVATVVKALFGAEPPAKIVELKAAAIEELTPIYCQGTPLGELPPSLPALASIAAWAVHLRAAAEELPSIATAIKADRNERANRNSRGELFLDQYDELLVRLKARPPAPDGPLSPADAELGLEALDAFDRAGIGREPLAEEARSDQMIRTAATAASVAVTVADSSRSGLSAIKPVTRTLRGAMLLPYWTVLGLAGGGTIARFLALWTLATGAVLVALPLLGVLDGWLAGPATVLGIGALLTAFGVAAMRTQTLLHSIVLLTPVIPLVAYAAERWDERAEVTGQDVALGTVGTVLALTMTLMLLGSLPAHLGSPLATAYRGLDRTADRHDLPGEPGLRRRGLAAWLWLSATALKVLGIVVIALLLYRGTRWVEGQVGDWKRHQVALVLVTVALVLAGWAIGYWSGWRFKLWVDLGNSRSSSWKTRAVTHPAGTASTWSVVYGTVFAVGAVGMIWNWPSTPGWAWRAALATAVVFAVLLLYVVPVYAGFSSITELVRRFAGEIRDGALDWPESPAAEAKDRQREAVTDLLIRRDLCFRCLLTAPRPKRARPQLRWFSQHVLGFRRPRPTKLLLSGTGGWLVSRVGRTIRPATPRPARPASSPAAAATAPTPAPPLP